MEDLECVSDEAKHDIVFPCPNCGNANLRPAAKFCDECGWKLQLSKIPEQKGQQEIKTSALEERNAHGSSDEHTVHIKRNNEEQTSSSDGDANISNEPSRQEMLVKAEANSISSHSTGLPENPSLRGPVENLDDSAMEIGKEGQISPIMKQKICEMPSLTESAKNVADVSAKQISRTDDSGPTSRQDICEKPSPSGGTKNIADGSAKENDSSAISKQDVVQEPTSTESAKSVADVSAKQVSRTDDSGPTSRQDICEKPSPSGGTKNIADGSAKENDSSAISKQDVDQMPTSTESAKSVADVSAKQVSRTDDSGPTSRQDICEKPSPSGGTKNIADGSAKENDSSAISKQDVDQMPTSTESAKSVADVSAKQVSRTDDSIPNSRQDICEKPSPSGGTKNIADGSAKENDSSAISKQDVDQMPTSTESAKSVADVSAKQVSRTDDSIPNSRQDICEKPSPSGGTKNIADGSAKENDSSAISKQDVDQMPTSTESAKSVADVSAKQVSRTDDSGPTSRQDICEKPSPSGGTKNIADGSAKENDSSAISKQDVDQMPTSTESAKSVADVSAKQVSRTDDSGPTSRQDICEKPSPSGGTKNIADGSAKENDSSAISKQDVDQMPTSTESAKSVADVSAKQVSRTDDSIPNSRQDICEKPSPSGGTKNIADGSAKENDSSAISKQDVDQMPTSTESAKSVADVSAKQVSRTDDSIPNSRQDACDKPSFTGSTKKVASGSSKQISKENDSSPISKQNISERPSSTESTSNFADDSAKHASKDIDSSLTSRQKVLDKASSARSTRNAADNSSVEISAVKGPSPMSRQDTAKEPSLVGGTKDTVNGMRNDRKQTKPQHDKVVRNSSSGDVQSKKTLLEIASSHPLTDNADTTVNPEVAQVSVDTEMRGNESGENGALKRTDVGSEPADDEDDSDLSYDSSVAEDSKERKKGSEEKKCSKKGKSKTKTDREKKKERKERGREKKKQEKRTDVQKGSEASISSSDASVGKEKPEVKTRSSKEATESASLKLPASVGTAKPQHEVPKEESQNKSVSKKMKSHFSSFPRSSVDIKGLQIHFHALLDPAFGNSEQMYITFGNPIGDWSNGPLLPLKCLGEFEGYARLHGVLSLPASFNKGEIRVPYKYVKGLEGDLIYEVINRPKVHAGDQNFLNRMLIIRSGDWKGEFLRVDNVVSPPESWNLIKSIKSIFTRGDAHKLDIEEFKLCLRAFLPRFNFHSFTMDYVISSSVTRVDKLYTMSFALEGIYPRTRFSSFTSDEKLEIFMSIFKSRIDDNYNLVAKGGQTEQLIPVLLSSITMASILVFSYSSTIPWKEYSKLIQSLSLTRLFQSGVTLQDIRDILNKHLRESIMIEKVASWLSKLLMQVLRQRTATESTSAWWSLSSLIAILYEMIEEEQKFADVEKALARASLSEEEKAIAEVETALHYAPRLEGIILSKFQLHNYGVFLKIKSLDIVKLLQTMKKLIVNKRWYTNPEIKELKELLVLLKSEIECYQPVDIERIQIGIDTTLRIFASLLKPIDCIKDMSVFSELLGILGILVRKAEEATLKSMDVIEGIFRTFEKGIEEIMEIIKNYFIKKGTTFNFDSACELLDMLFKTDCGFDRLNNYMDNKVQVVMDYVVNLKMEYVSSQEEILDVICSADANQRSPKMLKLFENIMNIIIDRSKDHTMLFHYLSNHDNSKLWRLFEKVLPDLNSRKEVLKKLLEWPATASFIKLSSKVPKASGGAGRSRFLRAMKYFKEYEEKLLKGDITREELDIICSNESRFFQISETCEGHSTEELKEIILERTKEKKFISSLLKKVRVLFLYLTELSDGKISDLKRINDVLQQDWSHSPLSQLCCRENGSFKELMFNLPDVVHGQLERMCLAFKSRIFCKMFKREASRGSGVCIGEIIDCLFEPVLAKICTTMKSLLEQSITLRKADKFFEEFKADNSPENIQKELKILSIISGSEMLEEKIEDFNEVASKVTSFFKLQRNRKKARNIIKLGNSLKLRGNFAVFEEIENEASFDMNQSTLNSLHDGHFIAASALEDVTDEMENCIDCILLCMNLITWLREKLKDMREVKTFVDLLSISAGETDYEADRVSCLHTVCLEFEPIIFKLAVKSGPLELISCCKEIVDKTRKEQKLLDKLVDCNRLLEWFKSERESYGSVATSSMMEAEAVNRRGYYIIGSSGSFSVEQSEVTLENSLHLHVPEKKNGMNNNKEDSICSKQNVKIYKLNDIEDLQSKLMLIGGQQGKEREMGQIEKDCFLQMFEAVIRVAVLYIQLCDSGCIKYLTWHSKFTCNLEDGVDAFRAAIESIEKECTRLETDLKEWKLELDKKRTHFPFLNYYTVRQLLMLQKRLRYVILKEDLKALRGLSAQVFSLLDEVYPGIDQETFRTILLKSSHRRRYGEKSVQDSSWMRVTKSDDKFFEVSIDAIEKFIAELEEEGHDEDVAKAATMHCGLKDRYVASVWAMEHSNNEEKIEELANQLNGVLERKEEGSQNSSQLDEIEDHFDVATASANVTEKDQIEYLTLEDLGKVLDELAKSRKKRQRKLRPLDTMSNRKPNLMTIPRDDLLLVVIDIYKQAGGCLPASGEVEICNHATSIEKIELLFRRALNDPNGIYTLAFIDELDYNVAVQAYEKLQSLQQERSSRVQDGENYAFNILLICSSEREDGSFLASAWDEYRIVSHRCPSTEDASKFLKEQFMCDPHFNQSDYVHAGCADVERSTVRVIKSHTAGTGKSLFISRIGEKLQSLIQKSNLATKQLNSSVDTEVTVTTSIQGKEVDQDVVVSELIQYDKKKKEAFPRIYHFDIASTVISNLDSFMFQLLIIGSVSTSTGSIWKKKPTDLYIIEITEPVVETDHESDKKKRKKTNTGNIIPLLPTTVCRTPTETFEALRNGMQIFPGFDEKEYSSESFQRVYGCLELLGTNPMGIQTHVFRTGSNRSDQNCLDVLLRYCGVSDPSWREIKHFVHFFNNQLLDCENSVFCNQLYVGDSLPGFKSFVINFMLQMSKDFATPSASEESEQENSGLVILRRRWEKSEHPYLFFNQDRQSLSFLGFTVNTYGDLMDKENKRLIQRGIMTPVLYQGLKLNGVELFAQYTSWNRSQKLEMLCKVMGIEIVYDPDATYELTIDNMMKILAIHMRFRCGIPVILMGETGCGKTRLIRFMCNLKAGPSGPQNMILVKVHGGVTESDIKRKVKSAIKLAQKNRGQRRTLETVLFFDEANTTSAIGLIKEIMCDRRMAGIPLSMESCGLKIIAACNPYRKHTDEMIKKLESAGLGYHVKSEDASEKLGNIPLRQLVYRVHKLPESMLPLVWDFGQLSIDAEILYAAQIVHRYARDNKIPNNEEFIRIVVGTLAVSQVFMREQKDECSFVSLRDVERGVQVLAWFYSKMDLFYPLIEETKKKLRASDDDEDDDDEDDESSDESEDEGYDEIDYARLALVLALSVCYAARLEKRNSYYRRVASEFKGQYKLEGGYEDMKDETFFCQQMFLDQLQLGENIAKNTALSENVFMMVVCIELRIPLFVVGKPGSSKSLAKTIIQDNMQGELSHSDVFKHFKQILVSSYQCSPLSTAEGIITTFRQCSRFQEGKDLDRFASVVVLDEVGLAEDSPRMPLKALHPLLEDGTDGSEDLTLEGTESKSKRVAFIGISNWALDPAKMNRGLMLTRGQPDRKELISSAEGICNSNKLIKRTISALFQPLAKAYIKIYKEQRYCERLKKSKKEEFFGLRDYYSLIKMIFNKAIATKRIPSLIELEHAVKRNFGGLEDFDTWSYFHDELKHLSFENETDRDESTIDVSPVGLLKSCLHRENSKKDTRYVLLMTENYAALRVLEKRFPEENAAASVIFGSSFPKDQEFTQICRDINKIKVCMETGMPVILLNMENLYESLYDALNQYYVYLGGQRYVDLGLGTHRVKCRVHENFKLIVVAEKSTVYESFPIPLINRLEKHFLVMSTSLNERQSELSNMINKWAEELSTLKFGRKQYSLGDSFVGFNEDTPSAVILETLHDLNENANDDELIIDQSKRKLLEVATPEAVARIQGTHFGREADVIWDIYFKEQSHGSLESFLQSVLIGRKTEEGINVQVTTFSRLLSPHDQASLEKALGDSFHIKSISLNQFQTEQQFSDELRRYIKEDLAKEKILILQCDNGDENSNLIASARHLCHQSVLTHGEDLTLHIIFIVNLRRVAHGCQHLGSFHGVNWRCVHIDEMRPSSDDLPSLIPYANHKISFIFEPFGQSDTHRQDEHSEMKNDIAVDEKNSEAAMDIDSPVSHAGEESILPDDDDIQLHNSDINMTNQTRSAGSSPIPMDINTEATLIEDSQTSDMKVSLAEYPGKTIEEERNLLLGILRRCVQPAIVQTATNNDRGSRLTKRIHMLLGLLSPEFQDSNFNYQFATVLLRIIYRFLREKESQDIERKQWFHDEATTGNNIQECGTFRRALSYRIEKEIIPILSLIISQIDVNSNLDLLTEEVDWKRDLWLEFFSSEEVIRLEELSIVQREPMRRKKIDGSFVCWFPFSSAIRDKLTSIMQAHIRDDRSNEVNRIIRNILKQSRTGDALLGLSPRQLKSYVHDLVFLDYDVNSEEHELITASIISRARRKRDDFEAVPIDIVDIHMIINQPVFRQRVQCFLSIVALMEGIATELLRFVEDSDDIIVDVLALQKSLERLLPQLEDILETQDRFVWTANVQEIKLATNQLLSLLDGHEDEFSDTAKKILSDARITWTRIQLLKIFIEQVCPPGISCMQIDLTAALEFFEAIQSIDDEMTSVSSWEKIATTLVQLDDVAQAAYSNEREVCDKLGSFKDRCMSFFMEAVSTFVFSSTNHAIEEDVIELMMSYVTTKSRETKQMTPFADYKVDSTPTIRSFLVQQLLKARVHGQMAEKFLQIYLDESNYSREDDEESRLELCLLLIHCYEDFKMADISKILLQGSQLEYVCRLARDRPDVPMTISNIDTLRQIAYFRVFICKVVEVAYCDVIEKKYSSEHRRKLDELYSLLQSICIEEESRNLREFFLRQFIRSYGLIMLKQLIANEAFHWLWPEEDTETQNGLHDRYIIYGDGYKNLREKIGEAVLKEDIADLDISDVNEGEPTGSQMEAFALFALYREITTLYLKNDPDSNFCDAILQHLTSNNVIKNQRIARMLIENKQGGGFDMLKCSPQLEQQHTELAEIAIHAQIVFSLKPNSLLLQPLALLAANPSAMINAYLPTMPSDHLENVFDAAEGKWQCYECPNGHPYVITECGRPYQLYRCPECNAQIGGENHNLTAGNAHAQRADRTKTGYILGNPNNRIDFAIAERELQPTSHSLLSVLLHAALLLGACTDPNAVNQMIHPQHNASDVRMFVWEHLQKSVRVLAKSLGRSIEETTTFIHLVLKNMLEEDPANTNENFGSLASKECRSEWEEKFNIRLLSPLLSSVGPAINSAQGKIVDDKRLGSSSLMKRLYEQDLADEETDLDRHAFDYVRFWRYRVPITVSHLQCSLQAFIAKKGKSTCQILQKFLDKVEVLNLVKNLPDVVRLQCIMSRRLSRQLSSESAQKETIKKVTSKQFKGKDKKEIDKLLNVYYATWRALKPALLSNGRLSQSDDCELTGNSPIGYILPSTKDSGKRALLIVKCLAEAHNEIVAERRKIQGDQTKSKSVPTQDATLHHLVAFDHDMDLIPMLYAHCSYSLEIGKGTTIDYNFLALERQLVTTFIAGKPLLDVGVLMVKFADDINNLEKFEELTRRIEQRQIPYADQHQMTAEFHDLAQVCDALRAVEIAIGLLSSTGAEPNYFYKKYLEDIRMDPSTFLVSGKMQSVCRVTHIRSIWTMLTVERAYRLHVNRQDPFDLKDMFCDEVKNFDEQLLRSMDLEHLLAELTEYIILEVPRREENSIDFELQECLEIFMDNKKSANVIKGIETLPSSLCLKHIFSFWKIVADARKKFKSV